MYIQYITCKLINFVYFRQKKAGRKKVRRENSKVHREIKKLKCLLNKQKEKNRQTMQKTQKTLRKTLRIPGIKNKATATKCPCFWRSAEIIVCPPCPRGQHQGCLCNNQKEKTQAGNVTDCNWEDP